MLLAVGGGGGGGPKLKPTIIGVQGAVVIL